MAPARETLRAALRCVPRLSKLDDDALDGIGAVLKPRRIEAGVRLFEQGRPGDSLFIVVAGTLEARVTIPGEPVAGTPGPTELALANVGPGGFVGELACIDPGPRSATVIAVEPSQLLELDRMLLHSIAQHAPELGSVLLAAVLDLLAHRMRLTSARLEGEYARRGRPALPTLDLPPPDSSGPVPKVNLRRIELLRELDTAHLQTLVSHAPPKRLRHGTVLFTEGEPGDTCLLLAHGQAVLSSRAGDRPFGVLEAGAALGLSALIETTPRPFSATLHGDGVVLSLPRAVFKGLLATVDPMAVRLQERVALQLARQLRRINRDLLSAMARPIVRRVPDGPNPWQRGAAPASGVRPSLTAPTQPPLDPARLPEHIRRALKTSAGRVHAITGPVPPPPWAAATPAPYEPGQAPPAAPAPPPTTATPPAGDEASLDAILQYLSDATGMDGTGIEHVVPEHTPPPRRP